MKKLAYIAIGAVFSLVLSYSLISWADNSTSSSQSSPSGQQTVNASAATTVIGEISFLDPKTGSIIIYDGKQKYTCKIDSQTKVMIDQKEQSLEQLKLGDQVELICNSDKVVRYIVLTKQATSKTTAANTANPNPTATPNVQASTQTSVQVVGTSQDKHEDNGKHKGWYKEKDKGKEKEKKKNEHEDENEQDD